MRSFASSNAFVVSAAHDQAAIAQTVNALAEAMPAYLQAL